MHTNNEIVMINSSLNYPLRRHLKGILAVPDDPDGDQDALT